jgi:hypothetical protein
MSEERVYFECSENNVTADGDSSSILGSSQRKGKDFRDTPYTLLNRSTLARYIAWREELSQRTEVMRERNKEKEKERERERERGREREAERKKGKEPV